MMMITKELVLVVMVSVVITKISRRMVRMLRLLELLARMMTLGLALTVMVRPQQANEAAASGWRWFLHPLAAGY